MRAITYHRYGPPEVLTVEDVPEPDVRPAMVKIRVLAAEATKTDCEWRSFKMNVHWFWLPMRLYLGVLRPRRPVLGGYFAGTVIEVGEGAEGFATGDEVYGSAMPRAGAYGEYVALPASYPLAKKPDNMAFTDAAALSLGGLNALHAMQLARIQPGERVLVNGAGGSIGAYGVQIAKASGAHVTGVDIGFKEDAVRRFGADAFIDYTQADFIRMEETYDVIFDMVPATNFRGAIGRLTTGGRYLNGNPRLLTILKIWCARRFRGVNAHFALAPENRTQLDILREMAERGDIGSIVERVFPMQDAAEAHRLVETENRCGAVVIDLSSTTGHAD